MIRLSTLTTVVLLCLGSNGLAQEKQHVSFKVPAENSKYVISQNVDVGTGRLAGLQGVVRQVTNVDPRPGGVPGDSQYEIEYSIRK
jgi:hypothetical protein